MVVALTTKDNPYDVFTQYDEWYFYDEVVKKYGTCGLLAHEMENEFGPTTNVMMDEEINDELEIVIDNIVRRDPERRYIKVYAPGYSNNQQKVSLETKEQKQN